jgi:hypothetical protein
MDDHRNDLHDLAARARQGDPQAARRLRELVAPQMVRIVRRALRAGAAATALERRILDVAESARRDPPDPRPNPGESLVRRVAGRLCDGLLRDRPAAAGTWQRAETVAC